MVTETIEEIGTVGSKEELFPSKKIREALGLKPGKKIKFKVENNKLIIEKIPDLEELLNQPMLNMIDPEELEKESEEFQKIKFSK